MNVICLTGCVTRVDGVATSLMAHSRYTLPNALAERLAAAGYVRPVEITDPSIPDGDAGTAAKPTRGRKRPPGMSESTKA